MRHCEENNIDYFKLTASDLKKFSDLFGDDAADILNPESSTERKLSAGSTSKAEVLKQIADLRAMI